MVKPIKEIRWEFVIAVAVLSILVVALPIYFINRSHDRAAALKAQEKKIQRRITVAKVRVQNETEKLNDLVSGFRNSLPQTARMQDSYSRMAITIDRTDVFFSNPDSSNPDIKIPTKTALIEKNINNLRARINERLTELQRDVYTPQANMQNLIIEARQDADIIRQYAQELSQIVNNLTPENSGLTEAQIESYQAIPPIVLEEVSDIIVAVQNTTPTNTQTTEPVVVTQEQVQAQEQVVAQAQAEVVVLQQELVQVQESIQQVETQTENPPTETNNTSQTSTTTQNQQPDTSNEDETPVQNYVPQDTYIPNNSNSQDWSKFPDRAARADQLQVIQGAD
jgi:hypothetical protein